MTGTTGHHHKSIAKMIHRLSGIAAPVFLSAVLLVSLVPAVTVRADRISELQQQKSENEEKLKEAQASASALEAQQEDLESEIGEMQMSLAQNLVSIELLEQEIAELDAEIAVKQQEYDAALAKENEQYDQMKRRIKLLYEKGNVSYMELFVKASSFSDLVNKSQYVEQLAEFDRTMLIHYQEAKQAVEGRCAGCRRRGSGRGDPQSDPGAAVSDQPAAGRGQTRRGGAEKGGGGSPQEGSGGRKRHLFFGKCIVFCTGEILCAGRFPVRAKCGQLRLPVCRQSLCIRRNQPDQWL